MKILGLGFLAASIWYLPWRAGALLGLKGRLWPWRVLLAIVMGAYLLAMHFKIFGTSSRALATFYVGWAMVFVFEIYSFIFLAAHHLLSLIPKRPLFGAKGAIALVAVLAGAMTLYQLYRTQYFVISEHEVPVPGLRSPVSILHVVDLHLGAFRGKGFLGRVIAEIKARRPDIVVWNGDLASGGVALDEGLFSMLDGLEAEQYYTTGNYDFDMDTDKLNSLLAAAGIEALRSRMVETHGLQLIGLDYMNGDHSDFYDSEAAMATELTIADVLPNIVRDRSKPTLLVHHSPVGLRQADMGDVDVMLTGNTHSGQKAPLTTMFRLSRPVWRAGPVDIGHMTLVVSQGGGPYGAWFRIGSPYIFQMITLVPG